MMSLVKEIQTTKFQIIQRYSHNYIILGIKTLRHLCRMFQDVSQFVWKKTSWAWLVGVACSTVAYPEILLFEIIWRSIWMKWNYPRCRATENMQWLADVEPMLKDWTIKEPYHDDCCINLHLLTKLDFGLISTFTRLGESWHLHGFQIAGGHAIIYLFQCMSDSELLSQNFSHNLSICKEIERFALTLDQAQWEFMGVLSSTAILHCYFCLVEAAWNCYRFRFAVCNTGEGVNAHPEDPCWAFVFLDTSAQFEYSWGGEIIKTVKLVFSSAGCWGWCVSKGEALDLLAFERYSSRTDPRRALALFPF